MTKHVPVLVSLSLAACPGTQLLDCAGGFFANDPNVATHKVVPESFDVTAEAEISDNDGLQSVVFTHTLALARAKDYSQAELLAPLIGDEAQRDELAALFYLLINREVVAPAWAPASVTIANDNGACSYNIENLNGHEVTKVSAAVPCAAVWTGTQQGGTLTPPDSPWERNLPAQVATVVGTEAHATVTATDISYAFIELASTAHFKARIRYLATGKLAQ